MSFLQIAGLSKAFGTIEALRDIDLTVERGEFIVIVGGSGSGKSTLLRVLAGLEAPSGGSMTIDGGDVSNVEPARRGVGMVFQSYALYPHLTVARNIAFPLNVQKMAKSDIAQRVEKIATTLDLMPLLGRYPRELSGGQRQRVAIGRAIIRDPKILLLDEPLSNLDASLRVKMRHMFARLHNELGTTMIYVTHDQTEGMTLANRIVVMHEGRIEQVGPPLDVYARPASVMVAQAIGSPAINLVTAVVSSSGDQGTALRLANGRKIHMPVVVADGMVGKAITVGIRPEHLVVDAQGPFAGPIELFERLGPLSFVHLGTDLDAERIVAQLPGDAGAYLGEKIAFAAIPSRLLLFDTDGGSILTP